MTNGTSRHALGWLEQHPEFSAAAIRAERLLQLQNDLRACAFGLELTALGIESEDLLVGTPNASAAAKLRQLAPSIARALQDRSWQIKRIRFRPQPVGMGPPPVPFKAKQPVPATAVYSLQMLSEEIQNESLKRALAHFVRTQKAQTGLKR